MKEIIGYRGEITFDTSRPDGAPRKVLDGSKLKSRLESKDIFARGHR